MIKELEGDNCQIYAVGFSLGANHLLRYLGGNYSNTGIKAAVSVSNPFDILATALKLRLTPFGIYDRTLNYYLAKPFI